MQVDVEMFLAASPPMFSPLVVGNLDSDYSSCHGSSSRYTSASLSSLTANFSELELGFKSFSTRRHFSSPRLFAPSSLRPVARTLRPLPMNTSTTPLRSCLVVREDTQSSSETSDGELSPTSTVSPSRHKKRVVFADDKGLSLTHVKVMTEPSDCPPRWSSEFLEQVTRGASAEVAAERWEVSFPQPASDYLNFRSRLETQNVSLENLVVQDSEQQLVGTVKVKNLCFSKKVFVRVTFDQWKSFRDFDAIFTPTGIQSTGPTVNLFDTFSFKIAIPATLAGLNRIELCICFKSDSGEYWDNNQGKNYVLVKPDPPKIKAEKSPSTLRKNPNQLRRLIGPDGKCLDATQARPDSWTEFASWNHLVNDAPYW